MFFCSHFECGGSPNRKWLLFFPKHIQFSEWIGLKNIILFFQMNIKRLTSIQHNMISMKNMLCIWVRMQIIITILSVCFLYFARARFCSFFFFSPFNIHYDWFNRTCGIRQLEYVYHLHHLTRWHDLYLNTVLFLFYFFLLIPAHTHT